MPNKNVIIDLSNIAFSYHSQPFLHDINLKVYENDFLGVIGPNGGGKTTLIKIILGLIQPDQGQIRVLGQSPQAARKQIGYLAQYEELDLDFPINVMETILLGRLDGKLGYHYNQKDHHIASTMLEKLNLDELKDKTLDQLSGGQLQRVFLARALTTEAKILILDEPLNNLDAHSREEFYNALDQLKDAITIIVIDHNLEMLSKHVNRVACINKCIQESLEEHDLKNIKHEELLKL